MRKIVMVLGLALALGGCAQLQTVGAGISLATKSIANPVTKQELYEIEASVRIAVAGLNAYKRACLANAADTHCVGNIATVQPYTRQLGPLLVQLRTFVKQNDQINATVVYNQLTTLYANMMSAASAVGIKLGSQA